MKRKSTKRSTTKSPKTGELLHAIKSFVGYLEGTEKSEHTIKNYRQLMNVPLDEVVRQLAKEPLLFQPGTAWSYSSAGIEVLVVERP